MRSRKKFNFLNVMVVVLLVLFISAILFPVFAQPKRPWRNSSLSRVKQLTLSALMYAADQDDHLPLAKNWMDAIYPYTKNKTLFVDPVLVEPKPNEFGFAYFRPLSGLDADEISNPQDIPCVFQSQFLHWNAYGTMQHLRKHDDPYEGNCFGFLDGHAKYFPPKKLKFPIEILFKNEKDNKKK